MPNLWKTPKHVEQRSQRSIDLGGHRLGNSNRSFAILIATALSVTLQCVSAWSSESTSDVSKPAENLSKPLQFRDLHPAFLLFPEEVSLAIKRGEEAAKKGKTLDDLMKPYRQQPRWVRGREGKVHESAVWCFGLDGIAISIQAYNAARMYTALNIPEERRTEGYVTITGFLDFDVVLRSVPKVEETGASQGRRLGAAIGAILGGASVPTGIEYELKTQADERDVKVLKFVLSDDQGHNYEAEAGATTGQDTSGQMTSSGTNIIPQTITQNSSWTATGHAYGSGGYATARANAYGTSTYTMQQYIPWSTTNPYYQARYSVRFSLFDQDGKPRIGPSVKEITLRIITDNGEQVVVYKLPKEKESPRK